MLTKIYYSSNFKNMDIVCFHIKKWIQKNKFFSGIICLDYKNRVRTNTNNLIPLIFNNKIVFKFIDTFQQNNKKIRKKIRKYVISNLKSNFTCIGGESYLYGVISLYSYNYYTNSSKLFLEAEFNNNNNNFLIDYNTINKIKFYKTIIINLSKINNNLIKIINKNNIIRKIIIISCNHKDFWKKIKKLTNFKLIIRKKFIDKLYFISVNILMYK